MNNIQTINTAYIRTSRTIETVLVSKENLSKVFFIYNYEGYSFRVYENHLDLIHFFQNNIETDVHFNSEVELDNFLSEVKLSA